MSDVYTDQSTDRAKLIKNEQAYVDKLEKPRLIHPHPHGEKCMPDQIHTLLQPGKEPVDIKVVSN